MPDLDDQIRESLGRLTGPSGDGGRVTLDQLHARRRRRTHRRRAAGALPVLVVAVAVAVGVVFVTGGDGTSVTAGPSETGSPGTGRLSVLATEVVGGVGGTTGVVMQFDGPLPSGEVGFADDIVSVDGPARITYAVQDPERAHVCDAIHNFGSMAVGTVDVLLPASWFSDEDRSHTSPLTRIGEPPKFVVCGPHRGYYQYSIWGPASADPGDVRVTAEAEQGRLTIDIAPSDQRATPGPGTGGQADAPATPTAADFVPICRRHVDEHLSPLAAFELATDAQAKVFEPGVDNGSRTVVLFDDNAFFRCLVSGDATTVSAAGGGLGAPTATLADDHVQVVGQDWSGGEPSGSCAGQPCGPATASFLGRVGTAVTDVRVTLPDGSSAEARIEPDGWFIVEIDVQADVPLFQQRIRWTLDDGTQLDAAPAELADPEATGSCANAAAAIQTGDGDALSELGIPPRLDADLITGRLDLRLCGSDNLTGEYLLVIGRTSGQVIVLRNTTRALLVTGDERVDDALQAAGGLTGAVLVADGTATALTAPAPDQPSVPVVAVLEDGTDP